MTKVPVLSYEKVVNAFSREAEKFLKLEKIRSQSVEEIKNVIKRMKTEAENFIKNGRR